MRSAIVQVARGLLRQHERINDACPNCGRPTRRRHVTVDAHISLVVDPCPRCAVLAEIAREATR